MPVKMVIDLTGDSDSEDQIRSQVSFLWCSETRDSDPDVPLSTNPCFIATTAS
ncbi:hypothetical protein BDV35DRAFT_360183 [Aspergillus flavus]|uniref:Uncharacterized protein n=1 Tax=Aspergillus flavus TaxID=5059 RepID=A0A5N6GPP2_ASPFL|nr:hypothetical protein BDV35DRAFT_360183 [Aspergillus flavus]